MSQQGNAFTDGEGYQRLMGRWSQHTGLQFLDWLDLPKGLRWLDVGCGNGAFTEVLAARAAPSELIGIDPSEAQLVYARQRRDTMIAQFHVGDAQTLPFADNTFDVAIMALVISFVPDPAKAVEEMARVVRPDGCVATYMWDVAANSQPHGPCYAAMNDLGLVVISRPSRDASQQEIMRALWAQAGLQSIESRTIDIPVAFSDFDDFWESNTVTAGPVGKAIADFSPANRQRLKSYLRNKLPQDANGRIAYRACANAVKGRVPG